MKSEERIKNWNLHPSMRGQFSFELYKHMAKNDKIWLVVGDLGYGVFDAHREDFPDRFINCGAAETSMMNIACGLALEGKIPFVYSITTFLLFRPFEVIRTYINHEKLNVKLVGSGRDKDYVHDGISHWPLEVKKLMKLFPHIQQAWPETKEDVSEMVNRIVIYKKPYFLSLQR